MLSTEFIMSGEPAFVNPAIAHFNFLIEEHHFEASGFAEAYETVLIFERDSIRINVVFAIPEAPFVVMQQVTGKKIIREVRYIPITKEINIFLKEYNDNLDKIPLEKWHKKLRKGEFNRLIDNILRQLASELRTDQAWNRLSK